MPNYAIGLILLTLGGILSAWVFWLIQRKHRMISSWTKAEGTVIGHIENDSDGTTMWAPVVEFVDASGQTRIHESNTFSAPRKNQRGDRVKIAFDPATPDEATLLRFADLYLPHLVGLIFGICFMLVGTLVSLVG